MKILPLLISLFPLSAEGVLAASKADLESFQMVWDTIHEKHWDLASTGVDWQDVYKRFKPRVEEAANTAETRTIINEMLGLLGQSHFQILEEESLEELADLEAKFGFGNATPGFKTALVDGKVFIVQIEADSEAAAKGLAIGDEILELQGEPMAAVVGKVTKAYADSPHRGLHISRTLHDFFSGYAGKNIRLKVNMDGQIRKLTLPLRKPKGRFIQLLNLSPIFYRYDSKMLDGRIGYISFNVFLLEVKQAFEEDILGRMKDAGGLILDLRGNPGGLGLLSVAIANRLVSERGKKLGEMKNEGGSLNFAIFPQKPVYQGPVAIIIDESSASTSEILAAGLQDLGRARIFGTRSAGAALPSFIVDLPNGDRFQYAIGDYTSCGGRQLEGKGVIPDEPTPHTLTSLAREQDAALNAAIHWIQSQNDH